MADTSNDKTPSVTIVVASGAGGDFLPRCLESLREQVQGTQVEVLVPDRCGGETAARVRREYPFATLIPVDLDHRPSVPELRLAGVMAAGGEVLAVLEEHCTAPSGWVAAIRDSFMEGDAAIGGPILDHAYPRRVDWAVYFSEYHNYLPPWPEGERYLLNGANIAYDREKLLGHAGVLDSGYWEVVLHPLLAQSGRFRSVPAMAAHHTGPFEYGYYLEQRYLLSRVWGGTQRERVSAARRMFHLFGAPAFPAFLLLRITRRVLASGRYTRQFVGALPALVPIVSAYTWGEWRGYLQGVGDALERVE